MLRVAVNADVDASARDAQQVGLGAARHPLTLEKVAGDVRASVGNDATPAAVLEEIVPGDLDVEELRLRGTWGSGEPIAERSGAFDLKGGIVGRI
jgi:hypothetical protein